ncbi:MAG TPA: hypothetical protein VEH49_04665 [Methylomirabilota bacterium]|nr:hypothetical protein [Methylomirabilota bacterium]
MRASLLHAVACPILLLLPPAGSAQSVAPDDVAVWQQRFDQENSSRAKEKLLIKLGEAEFALSRTAGERGDYSTVDLTMEKYRDNVRSVFDALEKEHLKETDPAYRSMEMHLRRSLRELQDTIISVPPEYVPPLQLVRKDLEDIDDRLLRHLFPKRPAEKSPPPKASSFA